MKHLLAIITFSILFSACSLPFLNNSNAGVQITSSPQAEVFIDSTSFGQTPVIQDNLKAGLHSIKVISTQGSLTPWEGQVMFYPGVVTVINRELVADPTQATGYSLSYEKIKNKNTAQINITTTQPNIAVTIDGTPAGFTPLDNNSTSAGPHSFLLSSPGFQDKNIKAQVRKGYKLIIQADLAGQVILLATSTPSPQASPSGQLTPSPTPNPALITTLPKQASPSASKPYVEILNTPTGFLRVRSKPKVTSNPSNEVAKVNPKDRFPYLDSDNGWYQIEYLPNKKGWVSATYAKLVE